MKAIRIRTAKDVHPEYSVDGNRAKVAAGRAPAPKFIVRDVGEIVEGNAVVDLCLGDDPPFAPHDEECRQALLRKLNNPRRKGVLADLKNLYNTRAKLSEGKRKYVESLFEKRASEIAGTSPAQVNVASVPFEMSVIVPAGTPETEFAAAET
jgi:hypothetical protein